MRSKATLAIIGARIRLLRGGMFWACAFAVLIALVEPFYWLAGGIFFCSAIGIAFALAQRNTALRELELCEWSAPLFGRQLARATALAPCCIAAIVTVAYWLALRGSLFFFALTLLVVLASTLVALSATLRKGNARHMYVAFAFATAVAGYFFIARASQMFSWWYIAIGLMLFAGIGFFALRQYGETLARYDPIDLR